MLVSRHQSAGRNHNLKINNTYFENMAKFKYLGMTVIHRNCMHEEIKSRLNSDNACYLMFRIVFIPSPVLKTSSFSFSLCLFKASDFSFYLWIL
jgi:hypothetical protein